MDSRRRAVVVVFCVLIAVDLFAVASSLLELDLLDRVKAGEPVTNAELTGNDDRQTSVGAVQFAMLITGAVVFIRWLRAAYRNVDVVAPGLRRYGHGWAIGAWFVPFLNLWRPKQIVNDLWRAGGSRGAPEPLPWWLNVWWGAWMLAGAAGQVAQRRMVEQDTIDQLRTADLLYIVSDSIDAIVAAIAIFVVLRITDRLDGKGSSLVHTGGPPASAHDDPNALTSVPPPSAAPGWSVVAPERVQQPG
jgi:hypothetical protein